MDPALSALVTAIVVAVITVSGTWLGARTPKAGTMQQEYIDNLREDLTNMRADFDKMVARVERLESEREELRREIRVVQRKADLYLFHITRLEVVMEENGIAVPPRPDEE